ncbi:MAG: hypothetical protein ABIN91_11040 [Mucilaginibacter sp.]|uniref:hypothetical protein n=1 Tax=Mucilaginibacter sp. TaxID=1882438 RepID=UPI003267FB73
MKILRDYQIKNATEGTAILKELGVVYLAMQVRTGKTATALEIANQYGAINVIFSTKKKVIQSIIDDYNDFGYLFKLTVINDESLHTVDGDFDLFIHDEHHRCGSFPKPGISTKNLKERFSHLPMIFLSGSPHPESFSQIFHQFWISDKSPFNHYKNFYQWFNGMEFVKTTFDVGYGDVNNYSNNEESIYKYYAVQLRKIAKDDPLYDIKQSKIATERFVAIQQMNRANESLKSIVEPYMIKFTQADAGFESVVNETVLHCKMKDVTYKIISKLKKDKVVQGNTEVILADTPAKTMSKIHQLSSGTVKFESGNSAVIDDSKAVFIKEKFIGKKLGIFYKFQEELQMLKSVFGQYLCSDLETFNTTDKSIALQIVSGREGISLQNADYLVYLNLDFSSLSYWQSRDRLTTMERKSNDVFWIFSEGGIEDYIYNSVVKKKDYTLSVFKKQFLQ